MNVINFISIHGFEFKVVISAIIVAAAEILLKKFGEKLPNFIVNYLSLFIAFAAEFFGNLITYGNPCFTEELLYGALLAYSLGTLAQVWVVKLLRGENAESELFLLVKSITENICIESASELSAIVKLLKDIASADENALKERIIALLNKTAKEGVSETEIAAIAELILQSAKQLKKER